MGIIIRLSHILHEEYSYSGGIIVNPLSANPTKWSNTLKQFVGKLPTNCLSVFDYFVGLELKGLKITGFRFQGDTSQKYCTCRALGQKFVPLFRLKNVKNSQYYYIQRETTGRETFCLKIWTPKKNGHCSKIYSN